jgi:polysaccharide transporter, PST family
MFLAITRNDHRILAAARTVFNFTIVLPATAKLLVFLVSADDPSKMEKVVSPPAAFESGPPPPSFLARLYQHPLVRNVVLLYGIQLSSYILPLLVLPYLARVLSPARFGAIAFAQAIMYYFLVLADYGFGLTATRSIAIHRDNPAEVSRIFSAVTVCRFLLMGSGFVVLMTVVAITPKRRANWFLFPVCYLSVLGDVLFPVWLYQGLEKMQHIAARDFTAKALALAATFLLVHSDRDYVIAAGLQPAGMVLSGALSLAMMPRLMPIEFHWPSRAEIAAQFREGWGVFLSLAANTTYTGSSAVLLGILAPPTMLAYYSTAYRLTGAIRSLVTPLVTAIYPHVSHIASRSSKEGARFLRRYGLLLALPFFVVSLVLFVGAPLIIRILFGAKYAYSVVLLRIMAAGPFLFALSHCYSTYFMLAFGYQKQWSRLILWTAILNFAALGPLLLLFPPAVAFASAGLVVDAFAVAVSYFFYRRNVHLHEHPQEPAGVLPPA